jgi:hypothetical protein
MSEGEVTQWLTSRGESGAFTLRMARDLAHESLLGWYIAPYSQEHFCIGKLTLDKLASRHIVTDEEGKALVFPTIEAARTFMQHQLGILMPQIFEF